MRARTALAGTTLALLTLLWSAPIAFAADDDNGNDNGAAATTTESAPAQPPTTVITPPEPRPPRTIRPPEPAPTTAPPEPRPPITATPPEPAPTTAPVVPQPKPIQRPAPVPSQPSQVIVADPKASLSVSPKMVRPGDTITADARCDIGQQASLTGDGVSFSGNSGRVDPNAGNGSHTVILVCRNGSKTANATDTFYVGGPIISDPKATLTVSPHTVRQGNAIYANGGCQNSQQQALYGDDVSFQGDRGWVSDNAREGEHTVTRVCMNGGKRDQAVDHFQVIRGDGGGANGNGPRDFWMSPRSGYRGDEVDVSVRCRDNTARLDSDALFDITLHGDGGVYHGGPGRLTGVTHVRGDASSGRHRVTVRCDGHNADTWFDVLRDRGDHDKYLDLSPGFGHRGDAIDVNVGCDSSVGSLHSDVLDNIDLDHDGRDWRYEGTTHVRDDADSGEHTVKIRCGGDTVEQDFFVQGDGDHDGDGGYDGDNAGSPGGGDTVSVYPQGAPETGGGPVDSNPAGVLALGLTGLTGAAGVSTSSARRGVRR
jgi:hypothetical protein